MAAIGLAGYRNRLQTHGFKVAKDGLRVERSLHRVTRPCVIQREGKQRLGWQACPGSTERNTRRRQMSKLARMLRWR